MSNTSYQPVMADFDNLGNLNKMWGPNGKVAFDPSNVAITGGSIAVPGIPVVPQYYNWTGKNLARTKVALARVLAGTGRGKIVFLGDSKTEGYGATANGDGITGAFANNVGSQFAKILKGQGISVSTDSFFGTQNTQSQTTSYQNYDPRVAMSAYSPSNWNPNEAGGLCLGGALFQWQGTTGPTSMSFTPAGYYDTIEVFTITSPGTTNNLNVLQGATSLGSINQNAAAGFVKTTYTVTRGTGGVINLTPAAAVNAGPFACGVVAKDSTIPALDIHTLGRGSAKAADINSTTNPWNLIPALQTLAPDTVVFESVVNDAAAGTSLSAYQASMTAILNSVTAYADVILVISNYTAGPAATHDLYAAVVLQLAQQFNLPVVDRRSSLGGTNAAAVNYGALFDTTHENRVGYMDKANAIATGILKFA